MSIFVSRSRVQKVENVIPKNLVLAARIIADMRPAFGKSSEDLRATLDGRPIGPLAIGPAPAFPKPPLPDGIASADQLKLATLDQISSATCLVEDPSALRTALHRLRKATTPTDVLRERNEMLGDLKAGHQRAFLRSLGEACAKAAVQVGLPMIEEKRGPLGELRLIATDQSGRGVVAEIRSDAKGHVALETEVVGVKDNSCHGLMEQFDQALEAQGVRSSASERHPTGGVPILAAAREFVRRKVECAKRRAQRLNQASPVKVRR